MSEKGTVTTDIMDLISKEEIETIEKHLFSLLEISSKYNIDMNVSDETAGIYNEFGDLLMSLCLPDSNLAKKVGTKTND